MVRSGKDREIVVGVDGWRRGWVAVRLVQGRLPGDGPSSIRLYASFQELLNVYQDVARIGVDIPIGLLARGERQADAEAQERLGSRRCTVFPTPPAPVLYETDYEKAKRIHRQLVGKGLMRQAHALRVKILEVREACRDPRIVEVHPELCFRAMANSVVADPKKSWSGQVARRRLLREAGIELPDDIGKAGAAGADDVLDAAACAWTAWRVARGKAERLPATSGTEIDYETGREICICA